MTTSEVADTCFKGLSSKSTAYSQEPPVDYAVSADSGPEIRWSLGRPQVREHRNCGS